MESVTRLIWILCVCVSAPVVVLSGLLPVIRESEAYTLTYISRRDLEEDEWTETQNVLITPGIPTQYDSRVSHEAIYHVISNALLSPSFSSLNPFTISNIEYYNGNLETYSDHDTSKWKSDNNEIFDEILVKISRYNETQLRNYSTSLEPGQFGTLSGIYIDIQRIPWWIERNDIQDIHSSNSIDLTISEHYQRTSTGNVVHFDGIPDAYALNIQLTSGLPHVMTSSPTERSFSRTLTSTYVDTLGQSQSLYTRMASSTSFLQSQKPIETDLPTLTPYHEMMMTGRTYLTYSSTGVMMSYRWVFPEEITNRLPSQNQYYEILATNGQSQETLSPNLFTGLSQPETSFSMASITGSSIFIQIQENTPILPPLPPETMTAGTQIVGHLLDTIMLSSPSFGQYKFMENALNLRPSKETFSIFLFTGQSLPEIKSSRTSMATSAKPSAHQANISISSPPPPEIMTAYINKSELSDHKIKTRLSSFEQYQFIENTVTLESSQKTLSNSLLNGLSWPDVEGSMNNIRSSATPSQYQSNIAMLQPLLTETEKYGTHEFGHSLVTIIPSSFEQYQPAENRPTHWPSQEKVPTILLTGLSQPDIESNMVSIISSVSPTQFQSNTAMLPPSPLEIDGSHRLGLSLETLKINSFSFGQHEFTDNTPALRSFQETSSSSLFTRFSQPEIQSKITRITSSFVLSPIQANTPILPTPPIETMTTDTHRFGSYVTTITNSLFPLEQYLFTENKTTVMSFQEICSSRLFTGLWQQEIQSSMTSIINSASTAQFQSNITILPPATPEAMTTDTRRFRNSLVSVSFFTVILEPRFQSRMTGITSLSILDQSPTETSILPSQPPGTMSAGIHSLGLSLQTLQTGMPSFGQYQPMENTLTLRSSQDLLSIILFTGQSQQETQSIFTSIASLSMTIQLQVNTSILPSLPPKIITAVTNRIGSFLETTIPSSFSFGQYEFIENSPALRPSLESLSTNLFTGISQPEYESIMASITSLSMSAQFHVKTPLFLPPSFETMIAGTQIFGNALKSLILSSSSLEQYQSIQNKPTLQSSQKTLSTNVLAGLSQPWIQTSMTNITSSSTPAPFQVNSPTLPLPSSETMIHILWPSVDIIITSSFTLQYGFVANTTTVRSSKEILSVSFFTGLSQPEIQSNMSNIASLYTHTQLQRKSAILSSSPPETNPTDIHKFGHSLMTIITNSSSFAQYQFTENTIRLSPQTLSTNLFTGLWQPEIQSNIPNITSLSTPAPIQVNKPIFMPPPLETSIAGTHRLDLSLKTMITSPFSLGKYQFKENARTLMPFQGTLSTYLQAETMLMSMKFISNVPVSDTTRLSTSDSYSNTIKQYYFIYPSIGPIKTSHIDTVVNVSQSSSSSLSSRLILLPSLTIKESKAIEGTTDRRSATKQVTYNQPSEVTHHPSTKPTSGPKTTLEKLCALACKLPFPPPKSCQCNHGNKFGSWS